MLTEPAGGGGGGDWQTQPVDEVSTDRNLSNMMTARSRPILRIKLLGKKSVFVILGG